MKKTHKVVYNRRYGGFGFSDEAVLWLEENGSREMKDFIAEERKQISEDEFCTSSMKQFNETMESYIAGSIQREFPRHHKDLVRCVEVLGSEAASGQYAELGIHELTGNIYRIEDNDGWESVYEPDDYTYIGIENEEDENEDAEGSRMQS